MEKNNGIHLLYKNLGETPNECILRFKKDNPGFADEPMTYAGRLDPMAEGLLLVLSGDEIKEKDKYLGLPKTYVFEVLWGFETDTLDVLGIVSENSSSPLLRTLLIPSQDMISMNFRTSKFFQKYPAYSSKPVNGKPLFEWAREGKLGDVEMPDHEVEIYDAKFLNRKIIKKAELLDSIVEKIALVKGDFRQEEIASKWKKVLSQSGENEFVIDTISLTVSSGFYVRQFVSDLAQKLGTPAVTFHIKRSKIGEFAAEKAS